MNDNNDKYDKKWKTTQSELSSALKGWQTLSERNLGPSPDEKMLQDLQRILGQLKQKMDELSGSTPNLATNLRANKSEAI